MIDLDSFDVVKSAEAGFEFEVEHPGNGEGIGVFLKIRGEESAQVRIASIRSASESIVREKMKAQGKQTKLSFEQQVAEQQAELTKALDELTPEKAAERVISWRGVVRNGEELPCTIDNLVEFFRKVPFAQTQVFEQSRNLGNFIQMPSQTSPTTRKKNSG